MLTLKVSHDCLLEGGSAELESLLKKRLTINNPKYMAAKQYGRWVGKKIKPQLCYYEQTPSGIRFPRGFGNQAVLLCRNVEGVSPKIVDRRLLLPEIELEFGGKLRDYQEKSVATICSRSFGVLEAGTGSGKTIMALAVIAKRKQPTLIIVHNKELLFQWRDRIGQFLDFPVGLVGNGRFSVEDITVAIINSAKNKLKHLKGKFGQVIVDECHRVPATMFTDVVSSLDGHFLLGLSATAFRSESELTKIIYFYMGDLVHRVEAAELQLTGAIVKPELMSRRTTFDYGYSGDYNALITALAKNEARNKQIIDDVLAHIEENDTGTVLIVSDRVKHCQLFSEKLLMAGINAALLTGQTFHYKRSEIVKSVQDGELQVLVATLQLIGEGFDCPGLDTLYITTPITFEGRIVQVLGRIMRPAEGKVARVYDYVDNVPVLQRSAAKRKAVIEGL